ncbi:MAG: hypothetical protein QXM12_06355 [Nitrososphaerota archaeon]
MSAAYGGRNVGASSSSVDFYNSVFKNILEGKFDEAVDVVMEKGGNAFKLERSSFRRLYEHIDGFLTEVIRLSEIRQKGQSGYGDYINRLVFMSGKLDVIVQYQVARDIVGVNLGNGIKRVLREIRNFLKNGQFDSAKRHAEALKLSLEMLIAYVAMAKRTQADSAAHRRVEHGR